MEHQAFVSALSGSFPFVVQLLQVTPRNSNGKMQVLFKSGPLVVVHVSSEVPRMSIRVVDTRAIRSLKRYVCR